MARRRYQETVLSLELGGCLGDPHVVLERCLVFLPPPPLAHARLSVSTVWALFCLNRRFQQILGPLFLWSKMEDGVLVQRLYRERGAQSCL